VRGGAVATGGYLQGRRRSPDSLAVGEDVKIKEGKGGKEAREKREGKLHTNKVFYEHLIRSSGIVGVPRPNVVWGKTLRRGSGTGASKHHRLRVYWSGS